MFKKFGFLFLCFVVSIFSLSKAADRATSTVAPSTSLQLTLDSLNQPFEILDLGVKRKAYVMVKEILDSHLNRKMFDSKTGFFSDKYIYSVAKILETPVECLLQNVKTQFGGILQSLDECTCKDFGRIYNSNRCVIEKALFSEFENLQKNKAEPLYYTSIGSGLLFQDWVIINKLITLGYRNIVINLIDPIYEPFINIGQEAIVSAGRFVIDGRYNTSNPNKTGPFNNCFYEFMKWFNFLHRYCYPELNVSVFLYSNVDNYTVDCIRKYNSQSDVCIMIDVAPELRMVDIKTLPKFVFDIFRSTDTLDTFYCNVHDNLVKKGGIFGYMLKTNLTLPNIGEPIFTSHLINDLQFGIDLKIAGFCGIKN